jgi:hypothetical protein
LHHPAHLETEFLWKQWMLQITECNRSTWHYWTLSKCIFAEKHIQMEMQSIWLYCSNKPSIRDWQIEQLKKMPGVPFPPGVGFISFSPLPESPRGTDDCYRV